MKESDSNPLKPKKYRKYKGKRIQRKETDRERKDRLFAGYDDFKRTSLGVVEEDDDCLIDDELSDDDFEDDDDCLIPLKWADLATGDPKTRAMMKQTITEARKQTKKKKEKKNCTPGNPYHNEDGEFTDSGVKGSWSISNPDNKKDCDYGKLKTTGRGKGKQWTKQPCGRKDIDTPNVKAKYRCKDGSVVSESDATERLDRKLPYSDNPDLRDEVHSELTDRLQRLLDRDPFFIKHLTYLVKPMIRLEKEVNKDLQERKRKPIKNPLLKVSREQARVWAAQVGFFGWTDFLLKLSAIEKAKKGETNQQER